MSWALRALLFTVVAVWGVEAAELDVCAMDEATLKKFLDCALSKAPKGSVDLWENTRAMFGGMTAERAIMSLCKSSPEAGASMITEFANQQTRADKPKFKKALKECSP